MFTFIQVFIIDQKLFTLEDIDDGFKKLNLRFFDGDKPSPLVGISLITPSSNLQQHGNYYCTYVCMYIAMYVIHLVLLFTLLFSNAIMDNGTFFPSCFQKATHIGKISYVY